MFCLFCLYLYILKTEKMLQFWNKEFSTRGTSETCKRRNEGKNSAMILSRRAWNGPRNETAINSPRTSVLWRTVNNGDLWWIAATHVSNKRPLLSEQTRIHARIKSRDWLCALKPRFLRYKEFEKANMKRNF